MSRSYDPIDEETGGEEETGGILSRENQRQTVQLLAGALREPLREVVREALDELESEPGPDGTNSDQFLLLTLLGVVAAMYLANRQRHGRTSASHGSGEGYGSDGDGGRESDDDES